MSLALRFPEETCLFQEDSRVRLPPHPYRRNGGAPASGRKNLGQGDRQAGEEGRGKNVLSPEFGGRLVCVAGQPIGLDGVRVRGDDPVLLDAGSFVKREFLPAVPFSVPSERISTKRSGAPRCSFLR